MSLKVMAFLELWDGILAFHKESSSVSNGKGHNKGSTAVPFP